MSRQRKRDQRSRLDLQVKLADLLVKVNDWNDTTSQSVAMGLMLLNLSYADLLPETTRVMSSIEMEQWLVQLAAIPFMETYAVCKHTASALRKYSDEERTVAPTFGASNTPFVRDCVLLYSSQLRSKYHSTSSIKLPIR